MQMCTCYVLPSDLLAVFLKSAAWSIICMDSAFLHACCSMGSVRGAISVLQTDSSACFTPADASALDHSFESIALQVTSMAHKVAPMLAPEAARAAAEAPAAVHGAPENAQVQAQSLILSPVHQQLAI